MTEYSVGSRAGPRAVGAREAGRAVEERRAAARYEVARESIACRVNPGHEVELLNVSAVGACVEAGFALLPGRPLQLHAHGSGRRAVVEARVTWCRVTALVAGRGVRFTAGLAFMRWIDLARDFALTTELALLKELREPAGDRVGRGLG